MSNHIGFILDKLRFNYSKMHDARWKNSCVVIYELSGFKNLNKWIKIIGSSNPKNMSKFLFIKKKGFYKARLNLYGRLKLLHISIKDLYKESYLN